MTELVLIAALDRAFAIGKQNQLPWQLPDDLKRFKALTMGKPILMGRKTAESLGRALPGRRNLVLTRSGSAPFERMFPVSSLEIAHRQCVEANAPELCVIGGGELFSLALPSASRMHLTWVDAMIDQSDAFFPSYDAARWRETHRERHAVDAKHAHGFEFVDYERA